METKPVCILLWNEQDLACNKFATQILQKYTYQVLHTGDVSAVLNAINRMKDGLELVLTNCYLTQLGGESVAHYIKSNIDLPIELMDPDKLQMLPKGRTCSFTAYVINGLGREEITKLRELALRNAKGKMVMENQDENAQRAAVVTIDDNSTVSETTQSNKRKGDAEKGESGEGESHIQKKGRVHWSPDMHKKFLEAIEMIGYDRAVPKKIVEVMNIPGLTRENVASHLQKHRESIKREIAVTANRANEFKFSPFFRPSSTTCFNPSRNSYFRPGSYNMPSLQQNSYVSNALNRQYLNTQNRFPFLPATERNNFTTSSYLQSRPKFVPKFQPNRNFRIYSDQTKNVLVSVNGGNAPNQTANQKFVGLKFANEGSKIQFGANATSQIQFPNHAQQNHVPDQNNHSTPTVFVTEEPSLLEDMLSECYEPRGFENQVQDPITQQVLPSVGTSGNEISETVPDQFFHNISEEALMNFEHEAIDTPSTFVPGEDILSQCYVPQGLGNQAQDHIAQLDGMSQHALPSFGTFGNEKSQTLPDQFFHNDISKEALMNFEHEAIDAPSTFVPGEDIRSQCYVPHGLGNQVQDPIAQLDGMSQHVPPSFGTSGNEKSQTVPHQLFHDISKECLMNFEQKAIDTPSTFVPGEDILSQCYVPHGLENQVQDPITQLAGMSQQVLPSFGTSGNEKSQTVPDQFFHNDISNDPLMSFDHEAIDAPSAFVPGECYVPHGLENKVQDPITQLAGMSQQVLPSFGTSGNEKWEAIPDQLFHDISNEPLMNFEQKAIDTPSTFVPDEDLWFDVLINDPSTSAEGSSENQPIEINEQEETDRVPQKGTGNTSSEFDWTTLLDFK